MGAECTFVVTIGREADGIAKLVDAFGGTGIVEYFDSPSGPRLETRRVPLKDLRRIELATQTRVFRLDPISGRWSVGRVDGGLVSGKALGKSEDHYHVRFPNNHDERVPISQVFVRRASPVEDPTEYLASMITDTPFFFDGRSRIVRHIANQRSIFGGLTGLASSAIELLAHQVSVVRKVLSDPIQRYLLADEVGLGKTIEAGILIRQHLLDHPDRAKVRIVVPDHLVLQWRKELRNKFYIYIEDERIAIVPLSSMHSSGLTPQEHSLLVIDEAHVSAEWAFSDDPSVRENFFKISSLARLSERVLLLSGTPVLYREKEFLAMLHLLDPEGYRLSEVDAFRKRIQERQTVAEAIVDLSDNANGMFVEDALERVESAFSNDSRIALLCGSVRDLVWDDAKSPTRAKALRELRGYIREAYKLDRRILRTRRVDPRLREHLPSRTGATVVQYPDPARVEGEEFLEAWRLNIDDLSHPSASSASLFAGFVTSALGHPRHLLEKIKQRIAVLDGNVPGHEDEPESAYTDTLIAFVGERELLEEWKNRLAIRLDGDVRAGQLAAWLGQAVQKRKHILFVSDAGIADSVSLKVQEELTHFAVIRYTGKSKELREFESAQQPVILVCDRRAEEGLNLQRAGAAIIHYDLPLDPSRIEQRIGRIDRIEARGQVVNIILATETPYEMAWIECLTNAIGVFDRSIAPLQFLLSTTMATIHEKLISEGITAFLDASKNLRDPQAGVLAELKKIDGQEAIDSAETAVEQDAEFFRHLVEADEKIAEVGKSSLDAWLVRRLEFDYQPLEPEIGRYIHNQRTLVPMFEVLKYFDESLDRASQERRRKHEMPLLASTFHRDAAERRGVPLLRIGNPMVDALERFVRDDPRGMAFGVWRTVPNLGGDPRAFFRFDFFVEAGLAPARLTNSQVYSLDALRRRADTLFPVQYNTIWLDSDMEEVADPQTLELVQGTFDKDPRADGSFDRNLSSERWQEAVRRLEISDWVGLCDNLRVVAEERLKESVRYGKHQTSAIERFRSQTEQRDNIYSSRMAHLNEAAQDTEKRLMTVDLELDKVVRSGIESPSIRVDSIGCVILASDPLEAE
jgi:ATP-dependent helicase HepA